MVSGYSLLTISLVLILGREGIAKLLDEGCRPMYIPMIKNGTDSAPAPYMALIMVNGQKTCGGSLITNRFVLTAKHCLVFNGYYSVRLGEHDTSKDEHEEEFSVDSIIRQEVKVIDIALLKLDRTVTYTDHIRPICIFVDPGAASRLNPVTEVTLTGWGQWSDERPLERPNMLQQAIFNRTHPKSCGAQYGYICAENPKTFACTGDSGGPLGVDVKFDDETVYAQIGVLHGGPTDRCANFSKYADVVEFTPWIVEVIDRETINE